MKQVKDSSNTLDEAWCRRLVVTALEEDMGSAGDITTKSIIPDEFLARGWILAKESGVIAGLPVAAMVYREVDAETVFEPLVSDGDRVPEGQRIVAVHGTAGALLRSERTVLNFVQHLSGIATLAARYVEIAGRFGVKMKDTRKTVPGMRMLEKYAATMGGCENHRMGLYDQVLIKNNHLACLGSDRAATVREAVAKARKDNPGIPVEVEVRSIEEFRAALREQADVIMLDNMDPAAMRPAVAECRKLGKSRPMIEVSGNVTLDNLEEIAGVGPDWISAGSITHSAPALDLSFMLEPAGARAKRSRKDPVRMA
jgi:nicotinate-nucleotide pyrophosphorylase (carboxylating)